MLLQRGTVMLPVCLILTCYVEEASGVDVVFVKENSSVLLDCPFLMENVSITWRGPPNLTLYGINERVNDQLNNIKHKAIIMVIKKNEGSRFNLQIENFSRINQGLYRCDTHKDSEAVTHSMMTNIAESPFDITLVSDNRSDILTGAKAEHLEVMCHVKGGLPEPTLSLELDDKVVNVTNTSMLQYIFVPSKDDSLYCFTCTADNGFFVIQTSKLLLEYGPPECFHEDKKSLYSIHDEIHISFNVYSPGGYLYFKCLDAMYNTFNNCSQYNLFVQDTPYSIHACNRSFMEAGYAISLTVSAKDFLNLSVVLIINVKNMYGNENCTFTFEINGNASSEYRFNWEICTRQAGAAGILLHRNGKFLIWKVKSALLSHSFVQTDPQFQF